MLTQLVDGVVDGGDEVFRSKRHEQQTQTFVIDVVAGS